MMKWALDWALRCAAVCLLAASSTATAGPRDDDEDADAAAFSSPGANVAVYDFADSFIDGEMMSATPGGAQDITFFRDRAEDGEIPHSSVLTPEGLLSEHDLPAAKGPRCERLLCPNAEATEARLLAQPEVRYLAQIGFSTNIQRAGFQRAPLDLVAVVDRSGSMTEVMPLVRASLEQLVAQLGPSDRLSVVAYGDRAETLVAPTAVDGRGIKRIRRAIRALVPDGSTAMEDGLLRGFAVAKRNRSAGRLSRVMLFTDERPNVGATDSLSFMGMAEAGSHDGIGMTTIGVGLQFGAELATKISSVRGGNLFFFADAQDMVDKFEGELDTMVTELAHDVRIVVAPVRGMKVTGIYGIPGDKLRWIEEGALEVEVATLFVSRKSGAIYFSLAPDGPANLPPRRVPEGGTLATVALEYTPLQGKRRSAGISVVKVRPQHASVGLARGMLLVDEATALAEATRLHHEHNDQEGAYQLVHKLAGRFRMLRDVDLAPERDLVLALERTLALRSGHAGEGFPGSRGSGRAVGAPVAAGPGISPDPAGTQAVVRTQGGFTEGQGEGDPGVQATDPQAAPAVHREPPDRQHPVTGLPR